MKVYAIYFTKRFGPGEHWDPARAHPSDLKQDWGIGDCWSETTVEPKDLPPHFASVLVEKGDGQVWDSKRLTFVDPPAPAFADPDAQALHEGGFKDAAAFLENRKADQARKARKTR